MNPSIKQALDRMTKALATYQPPAKAPKQTAGKKRPKKKAK